MRKYIPALLALSVMAAGAVAFAQEQQTAGEQERPQGPKITFPVAELGGCASRQECKTYCDDASHAEACISFAEKNGMMSAEDAAQARKFSKQTGPGGCMGSKCREYCSESAHFAECRKFAEEHGMAPKVKDFRAKEPQLDEGKAEQVLADKGGPGGCKTKDECRTYCSDAAHADECLTFAEDNGLMQKGDVELARKMMTETGPGGCKGIACKDYCEDESHASECLDFAEKNGLMDKEDAAKARTLMEKGGPGGCKGRACEQYCSDPAHQEACLSFAKDNGLISPEEADRMQGMMQRMRDGKGEEGGFGGFGGPDNGGQGMGEERGQPLQRGMMPQGQFRGPGGCTSRDECEKFCTDNPDKCGHIGPSNRPPQGSEGQRGIEDQGQEDSSSSHQDLERSDEFMGERGPQMMQMQQRMERGDRMPMQGSFNGAPQGERPGGEQFGPPPQGSMMQSAPPPPPPPPAGGPAAAALVAPALSLIAQLFGL